MSTIKVMVIKCVTALLISTILATSLVAYAASESENTITIIDGDKVTTIDTHFVTAEDILREAGLTVSESDAVAFDLGNGKGTLTIKRAFDVYVTVGSITNKVSLTEGTVADALEKANLTLGEHDICNIDVNEPLTEETYIDIVRISYITETYEETIPYTAKVEYSSSMAKGEKKVTEGSEGIRTVTIQKTVRNGVVSEGEVVSTVVTKEAVDKTTVIGTKVKAPAKKPTVTTPVTPATIPYSSIKTISSLKAPSSLKLTTKGIPVKYTKKVTVQATAYTDHTSTPLAWCAEGKKLPQTGYIAVNPKVIPFGTEMFIVSADGKYVYGYAIAADTGGFIKKRPNNVDLFFNTESECKTFGRRDVVIYFL